MPEKEISKVRICRRDYKIANDEWQPLYIQRLAEILNSEVELVEKETKIVDSFTLLIYAFLSIIDRLLTVEEKKTGSNQLIENEISQLNTEIKNIL